MDCISLENTKKIKLMDRVEDKYICTPEQLSIIFNLIDDEYLLQTNGEQFIFTYNSVYFDTNDFITYNAHINKEPHRQKIRIREYDDGSKYLEIKDKTTKTKKVRIPVQSYSINDEINWVDENFMYDTKDLHKTISVSYNRITLVDNSYKERITIDKDIKFHNYETNVDVEIPEIIIEVKHNEQETSFISNVLLSLGIEKQGFSKYRVGIELTNRTEN